MRTVIEQPRWSVYWPAWRPSGWPASACASPPARRLCSPQALPASNVPNQGPLSRVPSSLANPGPVSSATRARLSCPRALLDLSSFLHPVVSFEASSLAQPGPCGPEGHTNPWNFQLSSGSGCPGGHSLPSAAPNWWKMALCRHLEFPPSAFTTWELGLWPLRCHFTHLHLLVPGLSPGNSVKGSVALGQQMMGGKGSVCLIT